MHIVPAFKDCNQVSKGRGQGGLVTLWHKGITKYVTRVDNGSNFRLLATKFSFPSSSLLVVNSYFPCNPQIDSFDDTELLTLLEDIKRVVESSECLNVMLAGDLNSDFARQNKFTDIVEEYLSELGLIIFWQNTDEDPNHMIQNVDFTNRHEANDNVSYSVIDHFASSRCIYNAVKEAGVLHSGENTSTHSAIYAKIVVEKLNLSVESHPREPKVNWNKASSQAKAHFKDDLKAKLNKIEVSDCLLEL